MKKMFAILSVLFLSFACSTLAPDTDPASGPAPETTVTDPAKPIEVQAGEAFDIFIDSNPTTGYHWEIVGEMDGVEFVSRDYTADEPVSPGSGGVDIFTFKAVSSGQAQITLGSYSPDADAESGEPEQTVTFNIIVK